VHLCHPIGLHQLQKCKMVVVLAGVVEERRILAERSLDDLLDSLPPNRCPFQQIGAVGLGLVMLSW